MIRLLIDENLPASRGIILPADCGHVTDFGARPTELELWCIARTNNLTILMRDANFFDRIMLEGPPPKVIWVRLGNLRRADLKKVLSERWPDIEKFLGEADLIVIHQPSALKFQLSGFSFPVSAFQLSVP